MSEIPDSSEDQRERRLKRTADKLKIMVNTLLEKHLEEKGVDQNSVEREISSNGENLLQPFLEDIAEITGCMNSTIWTPDEDDKKLRIKAATGLAEDLLEREKEKGDVFYFVDEKAVTPLIWITGEIKYAYTKDALSPYQQTKRGKFDDIWKGHFFEVFYGFLLKPFGIRIGVIKIENPPGEGRLSIEEEKDKIIKKAQKFNLPIIKEQVDRLKGVNFNIDFSFLEEYDTRLPYYEDFMNYLVYRIKCSSRGIKGVESIESRMKSFQSVIEKICREDKLEKGETKYKKGYIFHLFTDLAGIRIIVNNLASLREIEDEIFNLIVGNGVGVVESLPPDPSSYAEDFYIHNPGASFIKRPDVIKKNCEKYEYNNWIENCRDDGYRGIHFVLGKHEMVKPIKKAINVLCEIQLRTIRQHSWANEYHELVYKKKIPKSEIREEMIQLSNRLYEIDKFSEELRGKIANLKENDNESKERF